MTQSIKIPVSADTGGAERAAESLAEAFEGVAASVGSIAPEAQKANRGFSDLVRRAREVRATLSRELKQDVSGGDAVKFMRNFAGMQPKSSSLRGFRTEMDWFSGHDGLFKDPRRAAEHRRRVLTYGMQGTAYARRNPGAAAPPEGPGDAGGSGGGGGDPRRGEFANGMRRGQNMALGFGRSMLALAGVGSIMAMAAKAVDLATEESTGTDTLKRRMGDLGVAFDKLRDRSRAAGDGLGVTFVESQRLAQSYVREVGNLGKTDVDHLGGNLRTSFGFARSYGIDPAASTQFFGQMSRSGIGRDEAGQRRLAMLIGDAVAQSGYGGKVEELLQAVADYTVASSRMTLTVANSTAFANGLTSLMSRGMPGLDPAGAAALLNTADQSVRRGGAMGEASLNFSYAALRNASPGIKPAEGMALMEGGLFGTTRGAFGGNSPLAKYMGRGVKLDDTTNFEKMVPLMRRQYGSGGYFLNAMKNHFGLSSHAQAAALADMSDRGVLGATSRVMDSAGVDPMRLNASGFQMVGALANAKGGKLNETFSSIVDRKDVSAEQKKALLAAAAAANGQGEEGVRRAMIAAVASLNIAQEKTPGSETRDAITVLTDKLTQAGGPLLSVLNPIRDAVVHIAEKLDPGYMDMSGTEPVKTQTFSAADLRGGMKGKYDPKLEKEAMDFYMSKGLPRYKAAGIVAQEAAESAFKPNASNDIKGGHRGLYQWDARRWKQFEKFAAKRGLKIDDRNSQREFAYNELFHGDEFKAGLKLSDARNWQEATAAGIAFERPDGYRGDNPTQVAGAKVRYSVAQRLASEEQAPATKPAAGAAVKPEYHIVEVTGRDTKGNPISHKIRLPTSAVPPKASGSAPKSGWSHAGGAPR